MSDIFDHEMDVWCSLEDDDDSPWVFRRYRQPQCKYCGTKDVKWVNLNGKWRLHTRGELHTCKQYATG